MKNHFGVVTLGEAMLMSVADESGALGRFSTSISAPPARRPTSPSVWRGWGSRLGADSMGRYLLAEVRREGIDRSHMEGAGRVQRLPVQGPLYTGGSQAPLEAMSVALLEEIERVST